MVHKILCKLGLHSYEEVKRVNKSRWVVISFQRCKHCKAKKTETKDYTPI